VGKIDVTNIYRSALELLLYIRHKADGGKEFGMEIDSTAEKGGYRHHQLSASNETEY